MDWARLDLAAIAAALEATRQARDGQAGDDESLAGAATARLIAAYGYLDRLLARRVQLFSYGNSEHLLELNTRVLCGVTPERRVHYARHIAATTDWFYDRDGGDIGGLADWVRRHQNQAPRALAAGAFVHIVSTPQLFIEGNRRTATLVASYLLARAGLPPLVVCPELYPAYQQASEPAASVDRRGLLGALGARRAANRFAAFLADAARPGLLVPQPLARDTSDFTII